MHKEISDCTEYIFAAALDKCENIADAEDLTQEVLLAAVSHCRRGGEITNLRAWLLTVLNRKWNTLLRRKYRLPIVSIDVITEEPEEEFDDDTFDLAQVRREIAYLAQLQRDVIVRHYLQGQKIQSIANELGIPKGTVLSRLSSGREQMKKGMESMELYKKQSYSPERLDIGCNGTSGLHDEPFSIASDDLMKQNIMIVAYEKPLTTTEIANALGIPMAYIEKAVDDLVDSQLMCRSGSRVFSDFIITGPSAKLKCLDREIAFASENYQLILESLKKLVSDIGTLSWYNELGETQKRSLEYFSILEVFVCGLFKALECVLNAKDIEFPDRPDGGNWIAVGNRYPADFDLATSPLTQYCMGGARRVKWDNILSYKSISLQVYDAQPDLNKYMHGPAEIDDKELCKLLFVIHQGIPFDMLGYDVMILRSLPHLEECGILCTSENKTRVAIPVISQKQYGELHELILAGIDAFRGVLEAPLRIALPGMKLKIPSHLVGRIADVRQYRVYNIPMAFMKKAISEGDFFPDAKSPIPPMLLTIEK